jgi:hypothetical protein
VSRPEPIKDRYLDLPKRCTVINDDDIVNLKIALETTHDVKEFVDLI